MAAAAAAAATATVGCRRLSSRLLSSRVALAPCGVEIRTRCAHSGNIGGQAGAGYSTNPMLSDAIASAVLGAHRSLGRTAPITAAIVTSSGFSSETSRIPSLIRSTLAAVTDGDGPGAPPPPPTRTDPLLVHFRSAATCTIQRRPHRLHCSSLQPNPFLALTLQMHDARIRSCALSQGLLSSVAAAAQ